MTYKFALFEDNSLKKYQFDSLEDAKSWADYQIEKFKVRNKVFDEKTDKYFINFREQFVKILDM